MADDMKMKTLPEVSNESLMQGLSTHLKLAREGESLSHDELLAEVYRRLQASVPTADVQLPRADAADWECAFCKLAWRTPGLLTSQPENCAGCGRPLNQRKDLDTAIKEALAKPTLVEALSFIVQWDSERVVQQARRHYETGERTPDGAGWETMWHFLLKKVLDEWEETHGSLDGEAYKRGRRDMREQYVEILATPTLAVIRGDDG